MSRVDHRYNALGKAQPVARATDRQIRLRVFFLFVLIAALSAPALLLRDTAYRGSSDLHSTIEIVGALIGLVAGFSFVARFYALGNRILLFIGLAYIINGTEDLAHGFLAFRYVSELLGVGPVFLERSIPGTYVTGRIMLGVVLMSAPVLAGLSGESWHAAAEKRKRETLLYSIAAALVTIVGTAAAFAIPLPSFVFPEQMISRPVDLISAGVLGAALIVLLRRYGAKRSPLLFWILLSLGVNVAGQIIMSRSVALFDAAFDLSHAYKVVGYLFPLIGFSVTQITDMQKQRESQILLDTINQDLTAINGIQKSLFGCGTEQEVATTITDVLVNKFDAYFARLWLTRPGDLCDDCALADHCPGKITCLHLIASSGFYSHIDGDHRRVPLGAFKIGLIAQGRGKTICNDVPNDERVHNREWAAEHNLRAFAGFPLFLDGAVIGVMAMFSQVPLSLHRLETLDLLVQLSTEAFRNVQQIEESRKARAAAEAANRSKGEFLANMSHEIRTPMTAILGFADLLDNDGDFARNPVQAADAIQTIRGNAKHLMTIVNDILDMSKIEAGRMTVERIAINPARIINEVAALVRPQAKGKGLDVYVRYDTAIPQLIRSDPTRLRQILLNLCGNAVKFTDRGSVTIRTTCDVEARQMVFRVIDTGTGMTCEQRDRIARFDAFTQADSSTTRKFGGTGLGLRISNTLAAMLGGGIQIESEIDKGSIFTVTVGTGDLAGVPMHMPERLSEHDKIGPKPASETVIERRLDGVRILLAEDGADNQRLITFHLKKAGAEVIIVDNGEAAAEAVEGASEMPHLVLMDMQMPVLDGYGATRRLRKAGYKLPILALTAHAMSGDRQKCLDAGCDDFLTKPIDRERLLKTICKHILTERMKPVPV